MEKKNYLNNKSLLAEVIKSKEQGGITDELANMFVVLVNKYSNKNNWGGYTFKEEMAGDALLLLCRTWDKFDHERFDNAFAYYTQIVKNAFLMRINKEKKHRDTRDALLVDSGLLPSYSAQIEHEEQARLD